MIDVHSHILPLIDDGSKSIEQSLVLVEESASMGITDIICTPHFRAPYMLKYEEVKKTFDDFDNLIKAKNVPIKLHLGREVYCTDKIRDEIYSDNFFMANSKYILIEFSTGKVDDIASLVYELSLKGYVPIVAHVERYLDFELEDAFDVKNAGGLIQVNADSIMGVGSKSSKKFTRKLLKERLVDFVASDVHFKRKNEMGNAFNFVSKRYGKEYAEEIFTNNAIKVLENI